MNIVWFKRDLRLQDHRALTQAAGRGHKLIVKIGNAVDVLKNIRRSYHVEDLWSHQETWNGWTYERDEAVKTWCQTHDIPWHEPVQNGVIRRLNDRDG